MWKVSSVAVFLLCAFVNGLTYVPDIIIPKFVLLMFFGAFSTVIGMLLFCKRVNPVLHFIRQVPPVAVCLWFTVVCYTVITWSVVEDLLEHGVPWEKNGKFFLKGRQVRELTEEEYKRHLAYDIRRSSAIYMTFSVFPAVFFLFSPLVRVTGPSDTPD